MQKRKALNRLKLMQNTLDRKGRESASVPPDDLATFVADGLDLLQRMRQRNRVTESEEDFDDDEAA